MLIGVGLYPTQQAHTIKVCSRLFISSLAYRMADGFLSCSLTCRKYKFENAFSRLVSPPWLRGRLDRILAYWNKYHAIFTLPRTCPGSTAGWVRQNMSGRDVKVTSPQPPAHPCCIIICLFPRRVAYQMIAINWHWTAPRTKGGRTPASLTFLPHHPWSRSNNGTQSYSNDVMM